MAISAVIAAAAVALRLSSGGAAPEAASAPAPSRDASAPAPASAEPSAPAPVRRPPAKAGAEPVTPAEPAAPAAPTTATLHITSDVPDAQVFIDREFLGTAPVTADKVAPGSHQINVSAPGYDGVAETVDVVPGPREIMISLKAVRLDEFIAVKHKHGFGSCTGRLLATPAGIRYETDDANDGFSVPLTGLETFTMDFAAKNLKIKIKGGRSYDFTDPGGKAEPLYFFHQAVKKARERLSKGSGVVPPSTTLSILGRLALPGGRIAGLGATADLRHGLPEQEGR